MITNGVVTSYLATRYPLSFKTVRFVSDEQGFEQGLKLGEVSRLTAIGDIDENVVQRPRPLVETNDVFPKGGELHACPRL